MRLPRVCFLLVFGLAQGIRLDQPRKAAPTARPAAPGGTSCAATCSPRGTGPESRPCPYAKHFEGKYWEWNTYRSCSAADLRLDLSCRGLEGQMFREEVMKQLGGKTVVFVGDSTVRQNFLGLLCMLWEEDLVDGNVSRVFEDVEHRWSRENKGFMTAVFPELGPGTNFTYVRKDLGLPGPFMMAILDRADITVANLGMHYHEEEKEVEFDVPETNLIRRTTYGFDVTALLTNVSARGRPGHRTFWRDSLACPMYDYGAKPTDKTYGCVPKTNGKFDHYNVVVSNLPTFVHVESLPVQDLYLPFWWAHPGGHDCCHFVGRVPGLLSAVPRLLVASLAQDVTPGLASVRLPTAHEEIERPVCPNVLSSLCMKNGTRVADGRVI